MKLLKIIGLVLVVVVSLAAAIGGLGLSYRSQLSPSSGAREFINIRNDGWIANNSKVQLFSLARRGNRALFEFNPWRPAGIAPARLRVSVCDRPVAEWVIDSAEPRALYLTGSCDPRLISFNVVNPFATSGADKRELGVQLNEVSVTSRLGVPVVTPKLIAATAFLLMVLAVLWYLCFPAVLRGTPALLVPVVGAALIAHVPYLDVQRVLPLWVFFAAVAVGLILGGGYRERMSRENDTGWQINASLPSLSVVAFLVVLFGAALRIYGLDFGLPFNFHPDEVPKVNALERMYTQGNLNPHYFLHPSLLLYCSYFMNTVLQWTGWVSGSWRETSFMAGRIVSVTAGIVSIYLLYLLGKRLYSQWAGILAAAALAVSPLHVTCSRYMKEDALLLCMMLAALVFLVKAVQEDKPWSLLAAGFFAGCTFSTKYTGMLIFPVIASAPWLRSRSLRPDARYLAFTVAALIIGAGSFLLCSPYIVLNHQKFLKDFASERHHALRGHTTFVDAWSQFWMYHYSRSLRRGMSLAALVLATIGFGYLLRRRRLEDLFVVGLILLFYLPAEWVKSKPAPQPERYILLCLPFLALAAAELIRTIGIFRSRAVAVIAALLLTIPSLVRSGALASEIYNDTRLQMANWMIANLPPGSKVMLDWKPYAPRLDGGQFEIIYAPRAQILNRLTTVALKESGEDYLVLSSLFYDRYFSEPNTPPIIRQSLRNVFETMPIVKEFTPEYGTYGFHNPKLTLFSLKPEDIARVEKERGRP